MKRITYFAFAKNDKGKIEQLLVTRGNGKSKRQEWTGKVYKTIKEAEKDMIDLNCGGVFV